MTATDSDLWVRLQKPAMLAGCSSFRIETQKLAWKFGSQTLHACDSHADIRGRLNYGMVLKTRGVHCAGPPHGH